MAATGFWTERLTDQARTEKVPQTLLGRADSPAEIASLIAWLLGSDGGWVTGQILSRTAAPFSADNAASCGKLKRRLDR